MSTEPAQEGPEEQAEGVRKARRAMAEEAFYQWHSDRGLRFIQPDEEPKPVDWLAEGLISYDGITLFAAKSKLGKSSLVYDLAIAAATGTGSIRTQEGGWLFDFKGQPVPTYYLDAENGRAIVVRRLDTFAKEQGGPCRKDILESKMIAFMPLEGGELSPFLHPKPESLDDHLACALEWGKLLREMSYRFVIIDPMSDCYQEDKQGRDENDRAFIKDFYRIVKAILKGLGPRSSILLVHHHRKGPTDQGNETASGHGQLLRTPTTLMSVSRMPKDKNPDGDLYELLIEGRETAGCIKTLKARVIDKICRAFDQVPEPVKEKKARGAPATAERVAREILEAVNLKMPEDRRHEPITPAEWAGWVNRVNAAEPEWQKSDETLKDYLRVTLLKAGLVERVQSGVFKIL